MFLTTLFQGSSLLRITEAPPLLGLPGGDETKATKDIRDPVASAAVWASMIVPGALEMINFGVPDRRASAALSLLFATEDDEEEEEEDDDDEEFWLLASLAFSVLASTAILIASFSISAPYWQM